LKKNPSTNLVTLVQNPRDKPTTRPLAASNRKSTMPINNYQSK